MNEHDSKFCHKVDKNSIDDPMRFSGQTGRKFQTAKASNI